MTSTALAPIVVDAAAHMVNVSGADTDAQLVNVWLSTKASAHTKRAYAARFLAFLAGKSIARATVADVQGFADSRPASGVSPARGRTDRGDRSAVDGPSQAREGRGVVDVTLPSVPAVGRWRHHDGPLDVAPLQAVFCRGFMARSSVAMSFAVVRSS